MRPRLVVAGGSWGGLQAVCGLLQAVPAPLPVPVLLVLHRSADSRTGLLRDVVRARTGHVLQEAEDKAPLREGALLLAPPGYHALVEDGEVSLSTEAPLHSCRPAIDAAFESAADAYGPGLAAMLLSGLGRDGTSGMCRVRRRGGRTFAQASGTAEQDDMPRSAVAAGCVDEVGSPHELGRWIAALAPAGAARGKGT